LLHLVIFPAAYFADLVTAERLGERDETATGTWIHESAQSVWRANAKFTGKRQLTRHDDA
jgi:hypothetical protein